MYPDSFGFDSNDDDREGDDDIIGGDSVGDLIDGDGEVLAVNNDDDDGTRSNLP